MPSWRVKMSGMFSFATNLNYSIGLITQFIISKVKHLGPEPFSSDPKQVPHIWACLLAHIYTTQTGAGTVLQQADCRASYGNIDMRISHKEGLQKQAALAGYIIYPLFIGIFAGWLYSPMGLALAYLIDMLLPKWAYELKWQDVERIFRNMEVISPVGAKAAFEFGEKRIWLRKVELGNRVFLALNLYYSEWGDEMMDEVKEKSLLPIIITDRSGKHMFAKGVYKTGQSGVDELFKWFLERNNLKIEDCCVFVNLARGDVYRGDYSPNNPSKEI